MQPAALTVFLVDDEPLARLRLRSLLEACVDPRAEVVAEAGSATQAQHWLRDHANHGHLYALLAYCALQEGESEQANSAWQKAQQFLPALKAETISG